MVPDVSQYAAVSASSIFAVYILVTFVKPLIDRAIPTTDPTHDWAVRLASCVFGVLVVGIATAVLHPLTGQIAFIAVTQGVSSGLAAIGSYHLLTGSTGPATPLDPPAPALTSGVTPLDPAELQAYTPPVQKLEITHVMAGQSPAPAPPLPPPAGDTPPASLEGPPAG